MFNSAYLTYAILCGYENNSILDKRNHLLEYKKDKHEHRIGAILAYRKKDGEVYIGVSLYNKKERKPFSREVAINKAIHSAFPFVLFTVNAGTGHSAWDMIPISMKNDVKKMVHRATRYFK